MEDAAGAPLVSCLMVTRLAPDRMERALAAVAAFQAQDHPARELVVVLDPSAGESVRRRLDDLIASAGPAPVRGAEATGATTLGALRNRALAAAAGDYVCQWDDDDIYHPLRLSAQLAALRAGGHEALYLQEVLQYFPASRSLYWTNWRATPAGVHPGTLLMRREAPVRYPESGPESRLGEDLVLARALGERGGLGALAGAPHLFAYVSHGSNSWDDEHHRMLVRELAVSRGVLRRHEQALRAGVAGLDLGHQPVQVLGPNGAAFEIAPTPVPA